MTEEERKIHFGFLVEQILYKNLQFISESTVKNKKEMAAQQIADFYEEYKEQYKLKSIKDVEDELDRIKNEIKKLKKITTMKDKLNVDYLKWSTFLITMKEKSEK